MRISGEKKVGGGEGGVGMALRKASRTRGRRISITSSGGKVKHGSQCGLEVNNF